MNNEKYAEIMFPGFEFHHWVGKRISKSENGYKIEVDVFNKGEVIDSLVYDYQYGDRKIDFSRYFSEKDFENNYSKLKKSMFVPYIEQTEEMDKIKNVLSSVCESLK